MPAEWLVAPVLSAEFGMKSLKPLSRSKIPTAGTKSGVSPGARDTPATEECRARHHGQNMVDFSRAAVAHVAGKSRQQALPLREPWGMVTRQVTYSLDALNLVSNSQQGIPDPTKKKSLMSITVNYADTLKEGWIPPWSALRIEASGGVFFSSLPIRSYSVAPVFNGSVVTDNIVQQSTTYPTVEPFAAVNYRLTDGLGGLWNSDLYFTAAVGVNPNTVSADAGVGPSVSWRGVMFSFLCHFGHEVRLTQGFANREALGPGFTQALPTEKHLTEAFAFGVSVRVPSITGR